MIRTDAINNLLTELNNEKAAVKQSQETRASLMTGERTSVQKQQAIVTNLIKEALPSIWKDGFPSGHCLLSMRKCAATVLPYLPSVIIHSESPGS